MEVRKDIPHAFLDLGVTFVGHERKGGNGNPKGFVQLKNKKKTPYVLE